MLNELNGYFLGFVVALIVGIKSFKRNGFTCGTITRFLIILLLIYYCTVFLSNIIFPMPVQPSVIRSGIHEKINYLMPFSELIHMYEMNVTNGNMTNYTFAKEYAVAVWNFCVKIIPIGLLAKSVYKFGAKAFLFFSALSVIGLEFIKIVCNLVTTVNYISIISEHILYSFFSLWLGFILYHPFLWIIKCFRSKSNIMLTIYEQLQ